MTARRPWAVCILVGVVALICAWLPSAGLAVRIGHPCGWYLPRIGCMAGSPEFPPSWLLVETLTVGQFASTYRNLKRRADRTAVARNVDLTAPVLESWMQTYVRVRNVCAHHGRLWNVGLGVYPAIPTSTTVSWLEGNEALPERSGRQLYPVLVSLETVLETITPRSGWASRLHELISTRPPMNLRGMGVPEGWADDPFWRRHIG